MEKYTKLKEGIIDLFQTCEDHGILAHKQWEEIKDMLVDLIEEIEAGE